MITAALVAGFVKELRREHHRGSCILPCVDTLWEKGKMGMCPSVYSFYVDLHIYNVQG